MPEKITPLLVEAVKEQQEIIDKQQKQIDSLTAQVEMLLEKALFKYQGVRIVEFIADYHEGEVSQSDVTVKLTSVRYIWCRTDDDNFISLNFFYKIIFSGDISEKIIEVNFTDDLIGDINKSRYEDFVIEIMKQDSRFSNIREV